MPPPDALFVSPDGDGSGTEDSPMGLAEALTIGGMIWLLPGRYAGDLVITTPNTTLRSAPGARAIIDGAIDLTGDGCGLQDLEITYTGWVTRISQQPGSAPTDIPQKNLRIFGRNTNVLDCIIHDICEVGWWKTAAESEIRRCLIYNNGWQGPDRGHGPAIYAQNGDGGAKWCTDNVICPTYNKTGFEFYGAAAADLLHFHIERNAMISTRFLLGSTSTDTPVDDAHVIGNLLWKSSIEVGYLNPLNGSAEIRDNYVALGRITPRGLTDLTLIGNTAINAAGVDLMDVRTPDAPHHHAIDGNSYLSDRTHVFWRDGALLDFDGWQAAGYDAGGSFAGLPTQPAVFVTNAGRTVTIFNWSTQPSVSAPIAGRYTNAQNVAESVVLNAGDPLPMTGWTVATPYAADAPLAVWDSRFGVFIVEAL